MGRRFWLILTAVGATLTVAAIVIVYVSRESWGSQNLGGPVAIGIGQGGAPKHGFLGIEFVDQKSPLTIAKVLEGSSAAEVGLQPGDVIVAAGSA